MRRFFVVLCAVVFHAHVAMGADVKLEPVVSGLTAPIQLEEPDDGSGRRLIAQQDGVVRVLDRDGKLQPEPFLDLRDRLLPLQHDFEERGLLGFALHPDFARNGRVFASYSAPLRSGAPQSWNHTRRVSEFTAAPGDLSRINPASERVLLEVDWPSRKHNGGGLAFGPDGNLYIGLGDGGASHGIGKDVVWDAFNVPAEALTWDRVAQDAHSPFGKILRIDVDDGFPGYAIPPDNPFAPGAAAAGRGMPEVWASGFRNPYRLAFDKAGELYATATAETLWESVYQVNGPGNYGWPLLEGTHCIDRLKPRHPPADCARTDAAGNLLRLPVVEYPNMQASHPDTNVGRTGVGTAITGARKYDGNRIAALRGKLLVSDWSADFKQPSGQLFVADPAAAGEGKLWPLEQLLQSDSRIIGLSADRDGEIYVLTNGTMGPYGSTGQVWRLVPSSDR
ncbi:PQQ-dependent sugar dehydrogenase [Hyphomicrobium sp. D-2]|uniref:PQQ-dependent sugar dehydrogenase n=1 Tax=Hyphomicrobium sp. D-2 TaxID=3041621 RepID=UPI002454B665|nr:PQQ-dependent sugar dehydrogenase [Hyphomicrobium sp. D-2]MDH4981073.1 PQQ-dependent sugar dehydrogenase [Hyphomicrobium sp. D-2]